MNSILISILTAVAVVIATCAALLRARMRRRRNGLGAVVLEPQDDTTRELSGAVRSTQTAEVYLPLEMLQRLWSPLYLERLARTYWRFLSRVTLGVIRVHYTPDERFIVAFARPLKLLTFQAPEYEMDADHGVVRWRIERGLLVARRGRKGKGYLQIDVRRLQSDRSGEARLHIEIEVANFYPAIASSISRRLYDMTQSRIHVIVTHAFLRSLANLDLAESRVGRFAEPQQPVSDRGHQGTSRLPMGG